MIPVLAVTLLEVAMLGGAPLLLLLLSIGSLYSFSPSLFLSWGFLLNGSPPLLSSFKPYENCLWSFFVLIILFDLSHCWVLSILKQRWASFWWWVLRLLRRGVFHVHRRLYWHLNLLDCVVKVWVLKRSLPLYKFMLPCLGGFESSLMSIACLYSLIHWQTSTAFIFVDALLCFRENLFLFTLNPFL